jgi:hypothetical protein
VNLFGNAPICASTVLECNCCRIHRYIAAPVQDTSHNSLTYYFYSHEFELFGFLYKNDFVDVDSGAWTNYYIGTKAKSRHLTKFTCKETLRQVFICLRPFPLLGSESGHILSVGKGRGEGVKPERRLGATVNKAGSKIPTRLLYLQSINSKNTFHKVPL